ncbi:hypothetical protein KAR34_12115 [bacterium]|nr:hypothetical protein [bacterium]
MDSNGQKLIITAFPAGSVRGRLVFLKGEVRLADGSLIASAKAKCLKIKT